MKLTQGREARRIEEDEGGWQTVRRKPINNRLTYSFFITGFPDKTSVDDIKVAAKHLGTIDDVFIARKRRYNNDRFGFIRFKNLIDIQKVEGRLNEIKLGDQLLKANLSNIPRMDNSSNYAKKSTFGISFRRHHVNGQKNNTSLGDQNIGNYRNWGRSFRDAVIGEEKTGGEIPEDKLRGEIPKESSESFNRSSKWKSFQIPDEADVYPSSFFGRTLIGEALDGANLCSVKFLRHEGTGGDFDVVYVGGLHVLLVFNQKSEAKNFLDENSPAWGNYFRSLDLWEGQTFPRRRIVGLRILGSPCTSQR
ncbi:hypothetical protein SSX86_016677 [Deinandra increscens subsp. villosa]|uniref:RRM domain-containing protein n=1 Tax=Deinandra increscens subsp. villosa TaxID=3103831 RepID=A0AAP0GYA7_9ASTR